MSVWETDDGEIIVTDTLRRWAWRHCEGGLLGVDFEVLLAGTFPGHIPIGRASHRINAPGTREIAHYGRGRRHLCLYLGDARAAGCFYLGLSEQAHRLVCAL